MKMIAGNIILDNMISLLDEEIKATIEYGNLIDTLSKEEGKVSKTKTKKQRKKSLKDKMTDEFLKELLLKPFIFYVKKGTLPTSNSYESFEKFADKIFYIDDIYRLLLCQKLLTFENKSYETTWIIMESKVEIKKTRDINNIPFLEYWMNKHVENNTSGKLDYSRMDEMFFETHNKNDLKKYFKKPGTYFYTNIFNLNLNDRKSSYALHELRYYKSPDNVILEEKNIAKKYNYICPICEHNYPVFLCGNPNSNVKSFIQSNSNYIEFDCDHKDTKYEKKYRFGFSADKYNFSLLDNDAYNKAFLYLFYLAKRTETQLEYLDENNEVKRLDIEKYFRSRDR